eukprot:gene26997-34875_t
MRTPLNTAFLGLKLLLDDLLRLQEEHQDSEMADRLETVRDVKESCDIAVNILNELLVFDKLESGMLKLEEEKLDPLEFLKDVI